MFFSGASEALIGGKHNRHPSQSGSASALTIQVGGGHAVILSLLFWLCCTLLVPLKSGIDRGLRHRPRYFLQVVVVISPQVESKEYWHTDLWCSTKDAYATGGRQCANLTA